MIDTVYIPEHLNREEAEQSLLAALSVSLIVITAPMGYGKTTMVHTVLDKKQEWRQIWLTLSPNEEESWTWQKLCGLLIERGICPADKLSVLRLPQIRLEADCFIKMLSTALTVPTYLVVDDYHECSSPAWNTLFEKLACAGLPFLHIVLISRKPPSLPFDELWIKGFCRTVDHQIFSLSEEEFTEYFRINGVLLSPVEAHNLYAHTDGWMAATYLTLMEFKNGNKKPGGMSITHLMKTSIYDKLSLPIQDLLKRMSLFGSFTAEQAAYICEQEIFTEYFETVFRRIPFIQEDSPRKIFTMHALLRSVASIELERSQIPKADLYKRCGEWHVLNGAPIPAIENYLKAGCTEKIFQVLEQEYSYTLYEKAPLLIDTFFREISPKLRLQHPDAFLPYIYKLFINGYITQGAAYLKEAVSYYTTQLKGRYRERLLGELYILRSFTCFNDLAAMTRCVKNAWRLMDQCHSEIFNSKLIFTYGVPEILRLYYNKPGELKKVLELEKEYTHYYTELINGYKGGWDQLFEAEYLLTTGSIQKAEKLAELACEKAKFRRQTCVIISSYFALLRCDLYSGRKELFRQRIQELSAEMKGIVRPYLIMDFDLALGYLFGLLGKTDRMAGWLREFQLNECNVVVRSTRCGCTTYGLLLIKEQRWVLLESLAEEMLVPYSYSRHIYVTLFSYLYSAISAHHLYGTQKAEAPLKKALQLAEADGIIMPFAELSPELLPLLKCLAPKEPYADRLLPFCREFQKGLLAFAAEEETFPQEVRLTRREREIMDLVRAGHKNSDISDLLNIALVTTEKTLSNVYRKLGVKNRTAALAKLREIEEKRVP